MIAYAALDLRDGQAVQLVGGAPAEERVRLVDPVGVARRWVAAGFRALHVVDLDAALGAGDNRGLVREIVSGVAVPVQVGGGVRDEKALAALLRDGAGRVVVGTRAIEDPEWLAAVAREHPGRVVLAADVRGERVLLRGWTAEAAPSPAELLESVAGLPLGGVLVTDVAREGRVDGCDPHRFGGLAAVTPHPLIAAGGISTVEDLRALQGAGVAGAVLGMALYTGALDAGAVAREFTA